MARTLLYHLNRLQDILSLPRTTSANYPVTSDPLHNDTILTEDIWESSKVVTGDLGRRGIMDVVSTTTSIVKGQNAYTLPKDICRLQSVEYWDGTYWRGPLTSIPYDNYVRLSASKGEGTPEYYTHTQSDARQVYLTVSDGVTESSFRDTGPIIFKSASSLSITSTGEQINKGDLIFNVTQDSGGVVEYLTMGTTKLSTNLKTDVDPVTLDSTNNLITLKCITTAHLALYDSLRVGDIILQESTKTWVVITAKEKDTQASEIKLTFDGVIRGDSFLDFTVSNGVNHIGANKLIIGVPDRCVVQSDNAFILDANQGMSGATSNVVFSSVGLDTDIATSYGASVYTMNVSRTGEDIDLTEYANKGYILSYTLGGVEYKAYIGNVIQAVGSDPFQSNLSLYYDASLGSAGGVINTSTNTSSVATFVTSNAFSITKPPFFVGDVVQIESQFATLDTIQVYPYPDRTDTVGFEGIRMTYIPYPVKPVKPDQVIELPDAFNDAILAKAHEYATRREINRTEPYEESIRRATSISRPVANTGLMRNQGNRFGRVANFVIPS